MEQTGRSTAESRQPGSDETTAAQAHELWSDIRSLPFDALLPVRRWIAERPWQHNWVRALLFFALFPSFLYILLAGTHDIQLVAVCLALYFALIWGAILYWIIGPEPRDVRISRLILVSCFTAIVGIPAVWIISEFPIMQLVVSAATDPGILKRLIGFIVGVGVPEESIKALPVLWLAFKIRSIRTPREAAFIAGISGLAFGVAEGGVYAIRNIETTTRFVATQFPYIVGVTDFSTYLLAQTLRMTTLPLFHAMWSAIVGYYIGLGILYPTKAKALVVVSTAGAATLHGVYNVFAGSIVSLTVIAGTVLLFIGYARSADEISHSLSDRMTVPAPRATSTPVPAETPTPTAGE